MAKMRDFNPKAVLVVRKASGMSLGGRRYLQGQPVRDDCISLRKRQQLFGQNYLCYPHDLKENAFEDAKVREAAANEQTEEKPETDNGDDAGSDNSETVSETQEGGSDSETTSEESTEEVAQADESESDDDDN